jgi:VWFA-related protein
LDRSGRVSKKFFSIMVGLLLGTGSFPQELNRPEDQPYDLKVPVELVLVPVTVQDKDGKLIYGLQKEDFNVYEEGMPERITYFSAEPSPLSVAVLVDRTIDHRTQEIFGQNMLALIEAFSAFDEIAFYQFLDTTQRLQDFTSNKEALLKVFARMQFVPAVIWESNWVNTTSLDRAIRTAAHDLQRRGKNHRRVIFAVSYGMTSASERQTYKQTKRYLLQNGIVVYGLGQGNSFLFRKVDPLKKYTEPTGGEVFYPFKHRAFSETYQKISETARNQYILGYMPRNEVKEITYRRITVRVVRRESVANVRNRDGYYAVPRS